MCALSCYFRLFFAALQVHLDELGLVDYLQVLECSSLCGSIEHTDFFR